MNLKVGGGRRAAVMAAVVAVLLAGGIAVAVLRSGDETKPVSAETQARTIELSDACTKAAQDKLLPLVALDGGQAHVDQVDGTDWKVTTAVNHKTKWADNWYDVTCVVAWTSPTVKVKSVETTAR